MPNYNYNYPYGNIYQPFQSQNQNYQQPQNQFAFVNGVEGAKSYQMIPNQTCVLIDSDNPFIYMKQTNGMGQATLKYYKMIEISEQELKTNNVQTNTDYALKSDIDNLSKRIDELNNLIKPKEEGK